MSEIDAVIATWTGTTSPQCRPSGARNVSTLSSGTSTGSVAQLPLKLSCQLLPLRGVVPLDTMYSPAGFSNTIPGFGDKQQGSLDIYYDLPSLQDSYMYRLHTCCMAVPTIRWPALSLSLSLLRYGLLIAIAPRCSVDLSSCQRSNIARQDGGEHALPRCYYAAEFHSEKALTAARLQPFGLATVSRSARSYCYKTLCPSTCPLRRYMFF